MMLVKADNPAVGGDFENIPAPKSQPGGVNWMGVFLFAISARFSYGELFGLVSWLIFVFAPGALPSEPLRG
jgi:hypothetical protein